MRHTVLSRSAVAVASLAIGSAALATVPANAASTTTVTQQQVLTAVNGVRAAEANDTDLSKATIRAIFQLSSKACDIDIDSGEYSQLRQAVPTSAGDDADGLLVTTSVYDTANSSQTCTFAAFATTAAGYRLSGTATVAGQSTSRDQTTNQDVTTPFNQVSALSGEAFTTPGLIGNNGSRTNQLSDVVASATGDSSKTSTVVTSTKVKDRKSAKEKKAAKAKYAKRIAQAKKKYAKALDKAGSSTSRKAAAKKTYKASRANAKTKYRTAVANFKIVKKKSTVTDSRPFSITTPQSQPQNLPF